MRLAFFAVPALAAGEAAAELNRFLAGHRVLAVDRHLVPSNRWNNLGFRLARAQTRAGRPAPDPAGVRSGRSPRRLRPANIRWGRRCAGRALDGAAKAHRRLALPFAAR